jgi:hypothetical protein
LETTVLLFDAKCDMCSRLARKIRSQATTPVELLALSDPDAKALLDEHYPTGWSHDFYLLEGNVARKGVRALPKIASLVGVRNFSTLASDYGRYLVRSEQCGEDHADEHAETTTARGRNTSRRSFGKLLGGAAGTALLPLSGVASADTDTASSVKDAIPDDLRVNVARVRPDGDGFAVEIEREQGLVRRGVWNDGPSAQNKSDVEMREVDQHELVGNSGTTVEKVDLEIRSPDASSAHERALRESGSDDSAVGAMRRYGLQLDRPRNTLSLNSGYGPMLVDGTPSIEGTLSGEISHDLAEPVVDFVTLETSDEASMETHLEAYITGLRAYSEHYAARNDKKFAQIYANLAKELKEVSPEFLSSLDEDAEMAPIQNTLAISSLPSWTYYVESPSASSGSRQDVTTNGTVCNCSCCPAGCCSGCDCGCSVCVGFPPISCGCDCCVIGCGAGCGCGCCYCP